MTETQFEQDNFLSAISVDLLRRGLVISEKTIRDLLNEGRIALFFDGLDEVVSVEKRASVVQQINNLVAAYVSIGNRFVVTSRPAAIHVVNLLPSLRQLALQGLSENEISQLAARILSLRVSDGAEGIVLEHDQPRVDDGTIINQLLLDCRQKNGVKRLAQNPLLLTLLVMIYANAGAPAAKRHSIYDEAIKTLASARQRQAGHEPVSVQDLRARLGRVALSVYRKESGFLPTRSEVIGIVRGVMDEQGDANFSEHDAEMFIQRVAESTGLISISKTGGSDGSGDIVSFMHHSFLEYFAAWELCKELETLDLQVIVREPRWQEVLTLVAGIVGESKDAAPVIKKILGSPTATDSVDARSLVFAMDCALETDIPSEAAVRAISNAIRTAITDGACRIDGDVRRRVGERLGTLWANAGGSILQKVLVLREIGWDF